MTSYEEIVIDVLKQISAQSTMIKNVQRPACQEAETVAAVIRNSR